MPRRWLSAALAAGILLVASPSRADPPTLDYFYMEPNEGGSSAGHVALGFGDRTYAYQRSREGWLTLERDDGTHLHWLYAVLGNRAVHRARVAISIDTFERLRAGFNRRYLIQQRQLALRDELAAEHRLLVTLAASPTRPAAGVPIAGAGYFDHTPPASPALRALRASVDATYDPAFLDRRIAELRQRLAALTPDDAPHPPPALTADVYPADGNRFAARYLAALTGLTALETLRAAPGLDRAGLVTVEAPALDAAERRTLTAYADGLRNDLVRLTGSAREDFGAPLLVGMARLAAIERSLAEDRLIVLDAFPLQGSRVKHAALERTPDAAQGLLDDTREDLATSRRDFTTVVTPGERDWVAVETAANRHVELARSIADRRDVRLGSDQMVPERPSLRTDLVVPDVPHSRLAAAERAADAAARAYTRAFEELYRYDLVRRNCVTETFRTVEDVLGPSEASELGGRIAATGGGGIAASGARIIPTLANRAVRRTWRVVASDTTPSYRQARVAALARAGNPVLVRLRESNVLTSTIYRRSRDDSTFLFFTDDAWPLRPLLGAANLAVGVGASALGVAQAPVDRGEALSAGLRGVLFSLPELFFVNVRKGSFDHVARNDLPNVPPWRESLPPSPQ